MEEKKEYSVDEKELVKEVGNKIRFVRMQAQLNQAQMAEKLGVSRVQYSRLETGQAMPNLLILHKLSMMFSVSLDFLVAGKGMINYVPPNPARRNYDFGDEKDAVDQLLEKMYKLLPVRYAVLTYFIDYYKDNRYVLEKVEEEFDNYRRKKMLLNSYIFNKEENKNGKKEG
jgi:transcriptional regulator with XRE-family HTH domain